MSWRIEAAMTYLAISSSGVLESLGKIKGGLVLLALCLGAGWGAGVTTTAVLGDYGSHPERIADLESRWESHTDSVTAPALVRIQRLEDRNAALEERWEADVGVMREMVHQLYCREFPQRCEATPARED